VFACRFATTRGTTLANLTAGRARAIAWQPRAPGSDILEDHRIGRSFDFYLACLRCYFCGGGAEIRGKNMATVFENRRLHETTLSTVGSVTVDGQLPWTGGGAIFILEPGTHSAPHQRIAAGDYPLELRTDGGKYVKFKKAAKLKNLIGPGLPHLIMHPDRLVLIHPGNTYHDSDACQLTGLGCRNNGGEWEVTSSQDAMVRLYPVIRDAVQNGGAIWRVRDIAP
jgi:hypothetical protein